MKQTKKDIIKSLAINKKDVGSAEIQIGLLSNKIEKLAEKFRIKITYPSWKQEGSNKVKPKLLRYT